MIFADRNISTKKVLLYIHFSTFVLAIIALYSCKDDQILNNNNEQGVDTISLYEWKVDTLYGIALNGFFIADTNNIYFDSEPPIYYNGVTYSELNVSDPNFICASITGHDQNNVYFGGVSSSIATIKKWNGNTFESFEVTNVYVGSVNDILVIRSDDLWISVSEKNYIYHLVNGQFIRYILDADGCRGDKFFLSNTGEIYLFAKEYLNDTINIYSYKLENNKFQNLSVTPTCGTCNLNFNLGICDNDVLNITGRDAYYFNGINWSSFLQPPQNIFNFPPSRVGGISKNEFVAYYSDAYPYINSVLIFRNNRWNWEKDFSFIGSYFTASAIEMEQNKLFILINDINSAYVVKGKLKP